MKLSNGETVRYTRAQFKKAHNFSKLGIASDTLVLNKLAPGWKWVRAHSKVEGNWGSWYASAVVYELPGQIFVSVADIDQYTNLPEHKK